MRRRWGKAMGGGKGGGGGGTQTSTSEPWGPSQPYLKDVLSESQGLYRQGGPQYYPGQTFVGPTQGQVGAWNNALGYADQVFGGQQAPQFGQATGALSNALQGGQAGQLAGGYQQAAGTALGGMLSGQPDYSGLQASVDAANAPILRQFEQDILPGLNQRASFLNNPTGSIKELNRVLPELGERMNQNATMAYEGERQRALQAQQAGLGMYGQFAQQGMQSQLAGAGLFPTISAAGQYPGQLQEQFANWGAGYQQQQLDDQINRWNYNQNLPWQNLNNYNSLVQGFGGLGGSQTASAPAGSRTASALGGAIGGAQIGGQYGGGWGALIGAGLGGAGGYYSDRRLKTEIEPLGMLPNNLMVYRFRYMGTKGYVIGFMADEVQELYPHAVTRDPNGYLMVDYAKVPGIR